MSRGHKPAVEHMVENVDRCSRAAVEHINEACKNGMEGEDGDQGPVRLQVTAERDIVSWRSERLKISESDRCGCGKMGIALWPFYGFTIVISPEWRTQNARTKLWSRFPLFLGTFKKMYGWTYWQLGSILELLFWGVENLLSHGYSI